jgi:poly-gamma-glutamate synthesis protein (capsule biosynthesis protein)
LNQGNDTTISRAARSGNGRQILLLLALAAVAVLVGIFSLALLGEDIDPVKEPTEPAVGQEAEPAEPVALSFVAVGDVMVHRSQISSQYDSRTGTYDYTDNFRYIKPYIQDADLALCNVETTFAGGTPTGYPSFNAPDALATALADAGFNVGLISNNHLYDKGLAGMERTIGILRIAGLKTAGANLAGEKNYTLVKVEGVSVGIVSYTYETPSNDGLSRINGVVLPEAVAERVNSFSHERLEEDLGKIGKTIEAARNDGADIIICYFHWGEEYQRSPNLWQRQIAESAADLGADIVFASHPHVIQSAEWVKGPTTGKEIPVFFSMGNFLSNQRQETLNNRYTEQGMIARVDLSFDLEKGKITEMSMSAVGTWLDKYKAEGKDWYAIIPLDDALEDNETLKRSGHLSRARQAYEDIRGILGNVLR